MNWSEKVPDKSKVQFYHIIGIVQILFDSKWNHLKIVKVVNLKKNVNLYLIFCQVGLETCLHNDSNYACTLCHDCAQHLVFQERSYIAKQKTLKGLSQTLFLIQMSIYRQNSTKVLSKGLTLKCFSRKVIGKLHSQSLLIKKRSAALKRFSIAQGWVEKFEIVSFITDLCKIEKKP